MPIKSRNAELTIQSCQSEPIEALKAMKSGSKYQPLFDYLSGNSQREITLSFTEIESLLQNKLPNSARTRRAWWSNRDRGALQAAAWMKADYLAEDLDLTSERVTFRKPPATYAVQRQGETVLWNGELVKALRRHMGVTQAGLAQKMGVRQQTVSEWEKEAYTPTLASSHHLTLVAEKANFNYGEESSDSIAQ